MKYKVNYVSSMPKTPWALDQYAGNGQGGVIKTLGNYKTIEDALNDAWSTHGVDPAKVKTPARENNNVGIR